MPEDVNTVLLREILKWIKISGLKEVKSVLESQLSDEPKKILAYHLSDGTKGIKDIINTVGISAGSVANYWRDWANAGLGELIPARGGSRFKRSFNLADFGIAVPATKDAPIIQPVLPDEEIIIQSTKEVEPNA